MKMSCFGMKPPLPLNLNFLGSHESLYSLPFAARRGSLIEAGGGFCLLVEAYTFRRQFDAVST